MDVDAPDRVAIARVPPAARGVALVLVLSLIYLVLQLALVRPYLWPAGHGMRLAGDSRFGGGSDERVQLLARPPAVDDHPVGGTIVRDVLPGSPAEEAGLRQGDEILALRNVSTGAAVDLSGMMMADASEQLEIWRDAYRLGLRGNLAVRFQRGGEAPAELTIERRPYWRSGTEIAGDWARRHLGMGVQILVFIGASAILFALRTTDLTAAFCVLALTLSAVGSGGPLMGVERGMPSVLAGPLTVFAWIAGPLAFPSIALAILYFPAKSPLVERYRWLHVLPLAAAAPMIVLSLSTALFLSGVDAARPWAVQDAANSNIYFASFAVALGLNVLAVVEGVLRYRTLSPASQRRVRLAVYTLVPGILAFAVKAGIPVLALLSGRPAPELPWWLVAFLQALILLPAFGATYAVAVHQVLGPRMVLRRSLQYAFARKTLGVAVAIPFTALVLSLIQARNRTLSEIIRGAPIFYLTLIGFCLAAWKYRDRARAWLDERFFREEYDARKILLSLASRVRFETDPSELSSLVVNQIDEALHPRTVAILASGIEEGRLTPIATSRGAIDPLPLDGGLVSMLRWSPEPLEVFFEDPRAGMKRLPPAEQTWLQKAGIALLVPILGEDRSLVALIALGGRKSEEPYTSEDRELITSIASQVGLALDVARLRRRMVEPGAAAGDRTTKIIETPAGMRECPQCGRCEEADGPDLCPTDGTTLVPLPGIPRVIDRKFRLDQRIGRGGMGSVYRARDVRLDRDVAIKVVRAELLNDSDARRRFRREAQLVARLQHPSIVSIFDYGTFPDGAAYLVMELVRGEDLRCVLTRDGRFAPARAARVLSQICGAIDAAHREGILHRDLKPENIFLTEGETDVKVLDFGVAKLLGEDRRPDDGSAGATLTIDGTIVGTPAYMAPEQLRGEPLDERSDVFSLGVMAFEMLTGELPFGRGPLADIVLRQARGVPPLKTDGAGIPPALDQVVRTALGMDASVRPPSPSAFASLVQSAVAVGA